MASIGLAYSSGVDSYNIVLDGFTEQGMPRGYEGDSGYEAGIAGSTMLSGIAYKQKRIWTISAVTNKATALKIDEMFRKWDEDRASGTAASIGLLDQTFGADVNATVVFTTAPAYNYTSETFMVVSFGLTEV